MEQATLESNAHQATDGQWVTRRKLYDLVGLSIIIVQGLMVMVDENECAMRAEGGAPELSTMAAFVALNMTDADIAAMNGINDDDAAALRASTRLICVTFPELARELARIDDDFAAYLAAQDIAMDMAGEIGG